MTGTAIFVGLGLLLGACGAAADVVEVPSSTSQAPTSTTVVSATVGSVATSSTSVTPTTLPPPPNNGWVQVETVEVSGVRSLTGFEVTPAGVVAVAKTAADDRMIIRRDADGVWRAVHEFEITGGAIPPTFIAHGPSGIIVLQSGDHQAAHFDEHHRLSVSLSNGDQGWRTEAPVGIPDAAVVNDVVGTTEGYVAVGWVREGDETTSRIWASEDGLAWTERQRWPYRERKLNRLAEHDGQTVALGEAGNKSRIWVTSDLETWEQHKVRVPLQAQFASIAWVGDQWLMIGSPRNRQDYFDGPTVMASSDGTVWNEVVAPDRPQPELDAADAWSGDDTVMIGADKRRAWDGNVCLLEGCADPVAIVYSTVDGTEWQQRPTPDDRYSRGWWKVARVDGTLLLVRSTNGQLEVWSETDHVAVTGMIEIHPTEDVYPWLDRGTDPDPALEIGVVYAMRVGTHCGIIHLAEWHGVNWWVAEDWEYPEGVDYLNEGYIGTIELVAEDRIVFRVLGEVYAEYEPRDQRLICS